MPREMASKLVSKTLNGACYVAGFLTYCYLKTANTLNQTRKHYLFHRNKIPHKLRNDLGSFPKYARRDK